MKAKQFELELEQLAILCEQFELWGEQSAIWCVGRPLRYILSAPRGPVV